ncbi:MAG: pimeloyl-[acyl-carrier protein] methyl ester esterase [Gammaproteobacteria bacterium HGW-Gammaproteobacteria-3]|jgi:pimeloyl-[acyl-carrier protein] methyl ester esterase|nr:MAG: pimeloyl-[acyl-carrier protein] methyl ester esterase [Gammaproteobacteria bacterium HGW-Gammaproteobacteria-3]
MTPLHTETYGRGKPLVLVHGWAMHSGIWRSFAQCLAQRYQVTCVDLPGHGQSAKTGAFTLPKVCRQLARQLPEQSSHWLGWSLGGSVVLEMARLFPERVTSVMLLASNPRFIKDADWPGLNETALDAFAGNLADDCETTLMRFLSLQIKGQPEFKELARELKQAVHACPTPTTETLLEALTLLKQADLRPVVAALDKPILAVLGGVDTLVPVVLGEALQKLNPKLQATIIGQAGHVPFLSHRQALIDHITGFLEKQ